MPSPRIYIGTIRIERIGISLICGGAQTSAVPIVIIVCVMDKDTIVNTTLVPSGTGSHRCIGKGGRESRGGVGGNPILTNPGKQKPHDLGCKKLKPLKREAYNKIIF
jgi:hypothetical protein